MTDLDQDVETARLGFDSKYGSDEWHAANSALARTLTRITELEAEVERLREALSRYADHDRVCDARGNALYACTCGFVEMIERVFPRR